jgi:hypothetical protein
MNVNRSFSLKEKLWFFQGLIYSRYKISSKNPSEDR